MAILKEGTTNAECFLYSITLINKVTRLVLNYLNSRNCRCKIKVSPNTQYFCLILNYVGCILFLRAKVCRSVKTDL